MNKKEAIKKRIRAAIKSSRKSQKEVAEYLEISETLLSRMLSESDKKSFSDKRIEKLSILLDINKDFLSGKSDDPGKPIYENEFEQHFYEENMQQYEFTRFMEYLENAFKISISIVAVLGEYKYELSDDATYRLVKDSKSSKGINKILFEDDVINAIRKDNKNNKILYKITFKNQDYYLNYIRFRKWMKLQIVKTNLELEDLFWGNAVESQDLIMGTSMAEDDFIRAMKGKDLLYGATKAPDDWDNEKEIDIWDYLSLLGFTSITMTADRKEFILNSLPENELKEAVEIMKKDNKGISLVNGKLLYNQNHHKINDMMSTENEKNKIRDYIKNAEIKAAEEEKIKDRNRDDIFRIKRNK